MTSRNDSYRNWKAHRSAAAPGHDFADRVMDRIHSANRARDADPRRSGVLMARISGHWLARVGLVAAGAAFGCVRLVVMARLILD